MVGPQIWLAEEAESRPAIEWYEFPGPTITLLGDALQERREIRMMVRWRDGVTGALDYLSEAQCQDGLRGRIEETVRFLGLRCEVLDAGHFNRDAKRLAAWSALVRYLHPAQAISEWPLCNRIAELIDKDGPRTVFEVSQVCKSDAETILSACAYLLHIGNLAFDEQRGRFDVRSRLRSASS